MTSADLSKLRISRGPGETGRRVPRWVFVVGALVVAAASLGAVTLVATRERAHEVEVGAAVARGGASGGGITANGYVVARTQASVSSKVAGRLAYLSVEEGDQVDAGDVIARLEAAEYEAAVRQAAAEALAAEAAREEARAALTQAERDAARARTLGQADEPLIPQQQLEDAETQVVVARSRLAAADARVAAAGYALAGARANLENTRVVAPFTGTILRKDAEVGEVVAPSVAGGGLTRGAVVTMADLSTLEVEVDVNEAYIGSVRHDQPAEVMLDAYPSEPFPAHVRQVVPTANRQKATVLVRVAIDTADPRILPEMGARVVFGPPPGAGDDAGAGVSPRRVFAPAAAVRSEGGQDVVYVVTGDRVRRQVVEAGPVSGGEREVRSGLSGGERVVLEPPAGLADGARVRVAET